MPKVEVSHWLNSLRKRINVMPSPSPVSVPKSPTTIPCARKTQTICQMFAPIAFMIPISRVFCTVTVMSVFMIPNAATTTMKNNRKNMTVRSSRTASKNWLFMSIHVCADSGGSRNFSIACLTPSAA